MNLERGEVFLICDFQDGITKKIQISDL